MENSVVCPFCGAEKEDWSHACFDAHMREVFGICLHKFMNACTLSQVQTSMVYAIDCCLDGEEQEKERKRRARLGWLQLNTPCRARGSAKPAPAKQPS